MDTYSAHQECQGLNHSCFIPFSVSSHKSAGWQMNNLKTMNMECKTKCHTGRRHDEDAEHVKEVNHFDPIPTPTTTTSTRTGTSTSTSTTSTAELDGTIRVQSGSGFRIVTPFPWRLHKMLEDMEAKGLSWIVSWLPDGRSFQVHCSAKFVEMVSTDYFRHKRFKSFQRQLYLYGFKSLEDAVKRGTSDCALFDLSHGSSCANLRLSLSNSVSLCEFHSTFCVCHIPLTGAYTHPCFVREDRKLCQLITRNKKSIGDSTSSSGAGQLPTSNVSAPESSSSRRTNTVVLDNHNIYKSHHPSSSMTKSVMMKPSMTQSQVFQHAILPSSTTMTNDDDESWSSFSGGRLAPICGAPSIILGMSILPDSWQSDHDVNLSGGGDEDDMMNRTTTTTAHADLTTSNPSEMMMNWNTGGAPAAADMDEPTVRGFNPFVIDNSHVSVVADGLSPMATFSYSFQNAAGSEASGEATCTTTTNNHLNKNTNNPFESSGSNSNGLNVQNVRDTFHWLVNDVHVSLRDLKSVLSIAPPSLNNCNSNNNNNMVTSSALRSPVQAQQYHTTRNNDDTLGSRIQEYREDIISFFGGR
jgi:hypothetical protein